MDCSAATPAQQPLWSYDDDYTGQEEWGLISSDFAACEVGTQQSPIHIASTTEKKLPELQFDYHESSAILRNIARTVEIRFADGSQVLHEGNDVYVLQSIEFHTPSEHIIRDVFYALEIQMVHVNLRGEKLIVAVLSTMKRPLIKIDDILNVIPSEVGKEVSITVDPSIFLPVYHGYFAYIGSLTIPPCTEGVRWRVMKSPIDVSKEQLEKIAAVTGRNARLTQPIYTRTIEESANPW